MGGWSSQQRQLGAGPEGVEGAFAVVGVLELVDDFLQYVGGAFPGGALFDVSSMVVMAEGTGGVVADVEEDLFLGVGEWPEAGEHLFELGPHQVAFGDR